MNEQPPAPVSRRYQFTAEERARGGRNGSRERKAQGGRARTPAKIAAARINGAKNTNWRGKSDVPRCPCGKMTEARAAQRRHIC